MTDDAIVVGEAAGREAHLGIAEGATVGRLLVFGKDGGVAVGAEGALHHVVFTRGYGR